MHLSYTSGAKVYQNGGEGDSEAVTSNRQEQKER